MVQGRESLCHDDGAMDSKLLTVKEAENGIDGILGSKRNQCEGFGEAGSDCGVLTGFRESICSEFMWQRQMSCQELWE